jgi:class 3 adenylate cyclase/tetratricopeptide (TPR) repeat protein
MPSTTTLWLDELGLGQYAETFARNDIDLGVIADLSDDDLRELGVSMGHRKVLLRAIASRGHELKDAAPTPPPTSLAERRQLTVMFCDLVDSTALAGRVDPEITKAIVEKFRVCCDIAVRRFGGHVAGFRGDGLLMYFGYPEAREHDPERAIRAGLQIIKAVGEIDHELATPLACRVGIATGEVVVGEIVGSDLAQERDVAGVVAHLAARLQQFAEPETLVVSDVTRRLVGDLFEYTDLGSPMLKGLEGPQNLWRVDRESLVDSRFEATHPVAELTPLVGREQELSKLLRQWDLARAGHGQAVLLTGEAGIGKSRVAHSLRQQLAGTDYTLIRYFCVEYYKDSALFPVTTNLERAAGFKRDDSAVAKLTKLDGLVRETGADPATVVPLFAALLSVPTGNQYPAAAATPDFQKERTLLALETHVRSMAESRPVLAIIEDMHWADPTTVELVQRVLAWLPRSAMMLVMTARPEFSPPWARGEQVSTLVLERLSYAKSLDLLTKVTHEAIPKEVVWEIIAKSDGIPLYLEEITKAVIGGQLAGRASAGAAQGISVPNTLQDSLAARLDKLPGAKRVAQIGATIGRQFSYELLAAVSGLPRDELLQALDQLTAAELLTCEGTAPNAVYTFKHALLQDWAYENQLRASRPALHRSIARVLEQRFPEEVALQPEVVALHYSKAADHPQAIAYWQMAAKRAAGRAAYLEALKHLTHAFNHLDELDESPKRDKLELELQVARGLSLERTQGYGAPDVKQAYERARELCQKIGETADMVPVLLGLYVFHLVRADQKTDLASARALAEQCVQLSMDSGRENYLVDSYAALGYALCYLGKLTEARDVLERCVELYERKWGELEFTITAQDPGVASLALLGVVLWLLGRAEESLAKRDQSMALAERLGEPINHAVAFAHAAQLHQLRREPDMAAEYAQKGIDVAKEHGYPVWAAACSMHLGIAKAVLGDVSYGLALTQQYLDMWRAGGAELNRPYYLAGIALAEYTSERPQRADRCISEALEHAERSGEEYFVPLLRLIRGEYRRGSPSGREAAEADFRAAYEKAHEQQSKTFELRALTGLCELQAGLGRAVEPAAAAELRRLVDELTAGGDMLELREATAVLA